MITVNFGIRITAADNRFIRRHFWQLQLFHQAVHSSDTDVYAIITLKDNYLYEQGRSRKGYIVTRTKNSRHTSRCAWNICKDINGQEYSDSVFFKACGEIAKLLGIKQWGGTWKQADTPHFEINKDWQPPKAGNKMTEQERKKFNAMVESFEKFTQIIDKLADRITRLENPMIYNYIDENMPEWARPTIQKFVDKGLLRGDENGLHLTDGNLKQLVINDRAELYD